MNQPAKCPQCGSLECPPFKCRFALITNAEWLALQAAKEKPDKEVAPISYAADDK